MLSMMPLLSVYWPYLITSVLVYVVYFLIFGRNRSTPKEQTENSIKMKSSSKEKKDNYSSKDDVEEDEQEAVQPLTFPEDTLHIPYMFNEISAVSQRNISNVLSVYPNSMHYFNLPLPDLGIFL